MSKVVLKFFPKILLENEIVYLQSISGIIDSVDEFSEMEIVRTPTTYNFRLVPSLPKYINPLIEELIKFHNLLGVRLNMGKSIKSSSVITFSIEI